MTKKDKIPDTDCNLEWQRCFGVCERCGVNYADYGNNICTECYFLLGGKQWEGLGYSVVEHGGKGKRFGHYLGTLGTVEKDWPTPCHPEGSFPYRFSVIVDEYGEVEFFINYTGAPKLFFKA